MQSTTYLIGNLGLIVLLKDTSTDLDEAGVRSNLNNTKCKSVFACLPVKSQLTHPVHHVEFLHSLYETCDLDKEIFTISS